MIEPRIEKLESLIGTAFRRSEVSQAITEYFGDDAPDSASDIRAGRILREGVERGVIIKVGFAKYEFTELAAQSARGGK